ncbi:uracil-DNA glycosylase [Granulicella sibirica]|uniref:Type-4 uracil-DNA glycosylase n=1 Tax=Granulicella sibirica TaxID=2479048 RepID=A0A4Q0T085_9BACT|nr:uracil-DNA glycosylase [Granulicella sibirica]RXH56993.1 Uracil-DNA glycosylase, family 4 [Granulicella sibirica]
MDGEARQGSEAAQQLRGYVEYFRDLGVYDFYRQDGDSDSELVARLAATLAGPAEALVAQDVPVAAKPVAAPAVSSPRPSTPPAPVAPVKPAVVAPPQASSTPYSDISIPKPPSFDELAPLPPVRVAPEERAGALRVLQEEIGDCTRCPLAYAGRHSIVFADGNPNARLMFVGEGPGADEDASGVPFVGKAGQLLNNMIAAMGLKREDVYIANIVKCRPPANRVPEPIEAGTCSQFLIRQMDIVQPEIVVALGATAATYLLGVRQSLASLRGRWHSARGAKVVVTYHPAFLLRDPRQKGEAWKDLQTVMGALGLKGPQRG